MKYFFSIFLTIILLACNKNENCECVPPPLQYVMEYTPSQCNEAWHLAGAGGNTQEVISGYFKTERINVNEVTVIPPTNEFITCAACTCSSGVLVTVKFYSKDELVKLEKLGFKLKK